MTNGQTLKEAAIYLLLKPKPAAGNAQGHTDDEPDEDKGKHGSERHSSTGSFCPNEQVEQEENGKYQAWD